MSAAPRISAACWGSCPTELTENGIVAVGYSLGGAMLLKYLGEEGSFSPLRAAATICAPLDLMRTGQHMMRPRNWLYHNYILTDLKKEALAEGARISPEEREIVRGARSVCEYDDRFISPRYGFRGADDYYELCAPLNFMPEIRVPTMVLAAATIRGSRPSTIAISNGRTIHGCCR